MTAADAQGSRCDADKLDRIVEEVWLALELEPLSRELSATWQDGLSAVVHIDGDETADVAVHATPSLAAAVADSMFGESGDTSMLEDAIGEIANQVAGGVKGLLPGECALHVPQPGSVSLNCPSGPPTCAASWTSRQGGLLVQVWTTSVAEGDA